MDPLVKMIVKRIKNDFEWESLDVEALQRQAENWLSEIDEDEIVLNGEDWLYNQFLIDFNLD